MSFASIYCENTDSNLHHVLADRTLDMISSNKCSEIPEMKEPNKELENGRNHEEIDLLQLAKKASGRLKTFDYSRLIRTKSTKPSVIPKASCISKKQESILTESQSNELSDNNNTFVELHEVYKTINESTQLTENPSTDVAHGDLSKPAVESIELVEQVDLIEQKEVKKDDQNTLTNNNLKCPLTIFQRINTDLISLENISPFNFVIRLMNCTINFLDVLMNPRGYNLYKI